MTPTFAHGYALLIGVTKNQVARWALPDVAKDITALSEVLAHPERCAYSAENIKTIVGPVATREGILNGLVWLEERLRADAGGDATAVIYYTGHGWRDTAGSSPAYYLIPCDVRETAVRARALRAEDFAAEIAALQPKRLLVLLDCCHAGGMVRVSGSGVRGLTPPDDIRHRAIRWDKDAQMWLPREKFESAPKRGSSTMDSADLQKKELWVGQSGSVRKLGRASGLWMKDSRKFDATRKQYGHKGPYTPILLEACRENEKAYEYRHGAVRHGAFTFSLCKILREAARPATRRELTFPQLRDQVEKEIATVVAEPQTPQLLIAKERRHRTIPGLAKARRRGAGK